ncbi:MAG TPA: type II CAAX endopeptidase family protein [Pyrinomonadaceae bacterium]|nr:type II CAAX endopeptidase family protein [Pyrinomonadaceae bacterium]
MDIRQIFINPAGRLRSGWRLAVFIILYVAIFFVLASGVRIFYAIALRAAPGVNLGSLGGFLSNIVFRVILLAPALIAGFICTRALEGLPWRALGISPHAGWLRDLVVGAFVGILSLALATAIATGGGGLSFTFNARTAVIPVIKTLITSAVLFLIAALAEEALFRGYPLQTFARARLTLFGVLLTSLGFVVIHLQNPNISEGIPYLNLLLAGIWLAVAYLHTRSLWFPLGIHWGWNWALGSLFGLPVSGIDTLAPHPVLRGADLGPAWLTGGSFGIEGGVACTVALIISTVIVWRLPLVGPTVEMTVLTSQENPVVKPSES